MDAAIRLTSMTEATSRTADLILNQTWLCVTLISTVSASTRTPSLDQLFPSSHSSLRLTGINTYKTEKQVKPVKTNMVVWG